MYKRLHTILRVLSNAIPSASLPAVLPLLHPLNQRYGVTDDEVHLHRTPNPVYKTPKLPSLECIEGKHDPFKLIVFGVPDTATPAQIQAFFPGASCHLTRTHTLFLIFPTADSTTQHLYKYRLFRMGGITLRINRSKLSRDGGRGRGGRGRGG